MIDLNWTSLSFGLSLFFTIAYFLYVIIFYRKYVTNPDWQRLKGNWGLIMFSLFLIIVVSSSNSSDWFSYQQIVWNYDLGYGAINHGEPVYRYIVKLVNKNYLLFRIIIWGGAFLLSCFTFRRFEVNVNVASFFLIAVFLLKFNYSRSTLAMASYFLGLSFLIKPLKNNRIISWILVGLFFLGAYEFHHSLLPVLLLSITAFLPINKPYVIFLLIILLPFLSVIIDRSFHMVDFIGDESISSKFDSYLERESESANFLGYISNVIMYVAFVLPILINTIVVVKYHKVLTPPIVRLFRVTFTIVIFAVSFLFMGLNSYLFVYRYLFMAFIPLTILTVYFYQNQLLSKKFYTIILWCGIIANIQPLIVGLHHLI